MRRRQRNARRKIQYDVPEDQATILLFAALKKDWAATKIQAVFRASQARQLDAHQLFSLVEQSALLDRLPSRAAGDEKR
jgi:hypothetical protein